MLKIANLLIVFSLVVVCSLSSTAQDTKSIYTRIKSFDLKGGKVDVTGLTLKRDRLEMTFTGTFYLPEAVDGRVTGAVFSGKGTFRAEAPKNDFERANLKRLIGAEDAVESDFTTAVIRFSDDSASLLGSAAAGNAPADMQKLALESENRVLAETGVNLSSRIALSILNRESQGFFFVMFDGGKRGRFSAFVDHQTRIPTDNFGINAGEKGLVYKYDSSISTNDVWLAFHSDADYTSGQAAYSDSNDVVDLVDYEMQVDVTEPKKRLGLKTRIKMAPLAAGVRAVPFVVGESLGEDESQRLKKQMRVKAAGINGKPVSFVQEDWEAGFTVFTDELKQGQPVDLELEIEGDFLQQPDTNISYPLSNSTWYPRHGYLDRSTYKLTYLHNKNVKVASIGTRRSEASTEDGKMMTRYEMLQPVSLVTFAVGPFKRHTEMIKWDKGGKPTPLEFNSLDYVQIEEGLMMAEMNNSVRYFHQLFGEYPYETYSGTVHPYPFGQGFPSMLMIPPTNYADKNTYSFLSHETAHQWWGNIVAWRSYRDQWLSEGFAEYSAVVYTNLRKDKSAGKDLIDDMRRSLREPPRTLTGVGKGKLSDVGPIILGHRLHSKKTLGGYQALVYNKGALVLRMLHFLFTNPSTGDGEPFYAMMRDFVGRYRNKTASSDDFRMVANEHFAKTPLAAKYQIKDLDWFFRQWVYESSLPSYRLEHTVEQQPDGSFMVKGNVIQEDAPENWFMPLPLVMKFGSNQVAQGTVAANGPRQSFQIKLPMKPNSVELDPLRWVLSDKTSSK